MFGNHENFQSITCKNNFNDSSIYPDDLKPSSFKLRNPNVRISSKK